MTPATLLAAEPVPLCWRRSFPGAAEQARAVRRFVGCLLDGFPRLDDVLLAADELVVNALRHTESGRCGGRFTVEVAHAYDHVRVSVSDQGGPGEPVCREAGELDESGRGLRTVSLTAASWGWHGNDRGRTVSAVFAGKWSA
ncbi:ATP-binding protein [Actinomadura opuntiae]|uniref:ATP-binding protein n=1 Tax=Actinomadura sp. OS1-43 TaxID=604315 RepID=UPI00255A7F52|nr:ATP-binding protein [Actinomadura sp. OS1-43]MDL4821172.1 ATP-binding protein [Actinomadura sp. OS1-43]